ncbi:MAG TPA: hypothetical protein VLS96_21760 [Nodosilinea sp.]|nr:hypothetical protein [Nodosilinea sp.]
MSQLFATALLLTLSAGSAGLMTVSTQPTQAAQPFQSGRLSAGLALGNYLAQADLPDGAPSLTTEVCVSLPNWQRPSEYAQTKQLESMPRYGTALDTDPLAEMAKTWWSHEVFSFTTYGLSARTDPLYLSGVWTALDDTWSCYDGDQPEQINQGELAELWLLNHRLVSLEWQDNQYVVTVEPTGAGLELVHFSRQERDPELPLSVITTAGEPLAVMSGDW